MPRFLSDGAGVLPMYPVLSVTRVATSCEVPVRTALTGRQTREAPGGSDPFMLLNRVAADRTDGGSPRRWSKLMHPGWV